MATHASYTQADENRRALVESMMSQLGITEAEANERLDGEDFRGLNSTGAARKVEEERGDLSRAGGRATTLSVPYDAEGLKPSEDEKSDDYGTLKADTEALLDTPPGVTPAQVVVGDEPKSTKKVREQAEGTNTDQERKAADTKTSKTAKNTAAEARSDHNKRVINDTAK